MKIDRAIEILNPEHREHYESIDPVNEACRNEVDGNDFCSYGERKVDENGRT